MRDEQRNFLTLLGHPPVRLTVEQTAWVLNCQPHDIPVLVAARLLKPLGTPQANATKYFSAAEVVEAAKDRAWLSKLTQALASHWQEKNRRKSAVNTAWPATPDDLNPPQAAAG